MQIELYRQILAVVAHIPYGRVASYGQIAHMAGLPRHARFVGRVLQNLEADSQIPWYRVVNAQGQISLRETNQQGDNIQAIRLLEEGVVVIQGRVKLKQYQWLP